MIAFGFMSNSLLIVTFFSDDPSHSEENSIEKIKIVSRIAGERVRISVEETMSLGMERTSTISSLRDR